MNGYCIMDYLLLKFTFVIIISDCFATYAEVIDIGNIYCRNTFSIVNNGNCRNKVWKGKCLDSCWDKEGYVSGTVQYSQNSPICKSAVHDLRISTWDDSKRTVSFQCFQGRDISSLIESLRQKVQSNSVRVYSFNNFTSPRISEEILDIISLHHNYIFEDNEEHKQECRIATMANRRISFNPYNRGNAEYPRIRKKGSYSYYNKIWITYFEVRAFWCRPDNNMLSSILSPAMSKYADFQPAQLTITASVGDAVTLRIDPLVKDKDPVWRKDDVKLSASETNSKFIRTFENVEIGNAGLYTLEDYGGGRKHAGVIRLIVRVCKNGMYGPSCEYSCPKCLNGGICHDITGECICPPGFNGSDCGNGCGEGLFGKDCRQKCFNETEEPISCKEILFCLPDPYGCSCISGFHMLYCNKTCDSGKYGAGCTQICSNRCKNVTSEVCDRYTGYCTTGCEDGWHGNACFLSYPKLKDPPSVETTDSNSITISFNEWKPQVDIGFGEVDSYVIQYKMFHDGSKDWRNGGQLETNQTNSTGKYVATIENLQPDSQYSVRIIVIDKSGSNQSNDIYEATAYTKCGVPQQPPVDLFIDASLPRMISVQWKLPSNQTWQCSNVTVTVSYTIGSTERTEKGLWKNEFSFNIDPYTEYEVKLWTVNIDGCHSNWSEVYQNISAEDAPSPVTNITFEYKSRQLFLSWSKPLKENGIIRRYLIQYYQSAWLHECAHINRTIEKVSVNHTTAYIYVHPSASYNVKISAITVKEGNWSEIVARSNEEVPDGPPTHLKTSSVKSKKLSFDWDKPACDVANGVVNYYKYTLNALEEWDKAERNGLSSESKKDIQNLVPFTTYTFEVFAGTQIGFSNYSANVTTKTSSARPPPPSNLIVYHRTENLLSLSWEPPFPPQGQLEKYKIIYNCGKCLNEIENTVKVNNVQCPDERKAHLHCYLLTSLKAHQNYSIKIWAFNEGIPKGSDRLEGQGETMESLPDPPINIELVNHTETSLSIAWKAPLSTNGNLTGYRVNITAAESYNTTIIGGKQSMTTGPNIMNICFEDLHPATKYSTTIEASTAVGYGLPISDLFATKHSVPIIDFEPEVVSITDSTIDLKIMPIEFTGGPISGYFVIVQKTKRRKKREIEDIKLISYNISVENGFDYYMTAMFVSEEITSSGTNFTVGDGKTYHGFYNPPLMTGNEYMIGIAVLSNYSGEERIGQNFLPTPVRVESPKKEPSAASSITGTIIGILFAIVIFFIVILAIIAHRNQKWTSKIRRQSVIKKKKVSAIDKELINMSMDALNVAMVEEITCEEERRCIPVPNLEEYVQDALQSGLLQQEFLSVEKGQCHSWDASKIPENRTKNRYGNLLAYDHTRVILTKIPGDPYSDYINANFVDGYCKPKKYIATQGPKPLTVPDFWRMIWQENVFKIIMCTNVEEGGKIKCAKYWPDEVETYGPFQTSLTETEIFADYMIRTLLVTKDEETREIKHFHFTTWPDHGVPMYATAVATFMQKTRIYQPTSSFPTIVHCSAGVGRTGTLILVDSMLDMAAAKQSVELTSHLRIMRDQRINLVENLDQYCFVYHALVDALCRENTAILCANYFSALKQMKEIDPATGKTKFFEQFQRLSKICSSLKSTDSCAGLQPINQCKNRSMDIIPPDHARLILIAPRDSPKSTYINAVFVNGYRKKDAFIVTQIPLPETTADFWNMLYHAETNTIVLLNALEPTDETSPQYWPEAPKKFYDIEVSNVGSDSFGAISIRTFELRKKKEETPKIIKQFHLTNWHPSDSLPPSDDVILYLIEKVERWQQQCRAKSIVVQCLNGVRACGIYCTAVFTCDKMKAEQEVDVFLAVKSIRSNRPEFIENEEQYTYCHQIALAFLNSFEIYANFQ